MRKYLDSLFEFLAVCSYVIYLNFTRCIYPFQEYSYDDSYYI